MTFASHVLELDKILDQLAQRTAFSASRALAAVLEPSEDVDLVRMRQARTTEARRLADAKPTLGMAGARDVRPHVERASLGGMLAAEELLEIAGVIRCSRLWRSTLLRLRESFPHLAAIADALGEHRPLMEQIGEAISENGEVLDAASAELRRIRVGLRISQERLLARLQEIISSPDTRVALQEPIVTQRNGRYVVPVKAESRGRIRGIVHDQSASGATIFVEPLEVVELANRWRGLQLEEEHEIERILRELSRQVADDAVGLGITVEALAEIDLQRAKARLANDMRAEPPEIAGWETRGPDEPVLRLEEARHPLLGPGAVPLTIELGGTFDMLVITGPNTGGKTVALKTIGLHVLMAQVGLHLPTAPGSCLRPFRNVYADIGDEQSIEQSLSTFSSHVTHIVDMLRGADDRSLLLLDELGAGTDPQEGSALARSILEHLRQRRVFAVVTTHYTDLKLYAYAAPRVENASVEFDAETLSPTYRLLVGQAGRSNALEIAGRLGVARAILDRARASLNPQNVEADRLLANLQAERRSTEHARQQAERERKEAARLRTELAKAQREAQRDRQRLWQEAEHASREELADLRRQMERLLREAQATRGDRQRAAELVNEAASLRAVRPHDEAPVLEPELIVEEPEPAPARAQVRVGADVVVPHLGVPGTIVRIEGPEAEVSVRGMRVRLKTSDLAAARELTRSERAEAQRESTPRILLTNEDRSVGLQLDLRGQRRDAVGEEVDRYLNEAYLSGLRSVRIVHGKGTGAVRQAVHDVLASHPLVRAFNTAPRDAGGEGATEVQLVA